MKFMIDTILKRLLFVTLIIVNLCCVISVWKISDIQDSIERIVRNVAIDCAGVKRAVDSVCNEISHLRNEISCLGN